METIDRAAEWRRLKDTYRHKSDDELAILGDEAYQLTELAQQALAAEVASRHMDVSPRLTPPEPEAANEADIGDEADGALVDEAEEIEGEYEFNPEALDLVPLTRVWDREEARRTKAVMDDCGVPSYLGDENIENVDEYKGSFEGGVDLKVPRVFSQRAASGLANHPPYAEEGVTAFEPEADAEFAICCPKCRSAEVVFEGRNGEMKGNAAFHAKFRWYCDSCGHAWEDDGVEQPV